MKTQNNTLFRGLSFLAIAAMLLAPVALFTKPASAAQIVNRKVTLEAGATDGGSAPGGVVNHFFEFTLPGGTNVGSMKFEYCTTAAPVNGSDPCIAPAGLDLRTATLSNQTGATGFTNLTHVPFAAPNTGPQENVLYVSRVAPASVAANQAASYRLSGVTNPTAEMTFFVRIATYASLDATGSPEDAGTVTASTAEPIDLTGTMPESLVFCTGAEVPLNVNNVPDCAAATPGDIPFNQLFSPTDTAVATSQMAASTNAGAGYVITVNGPTLTSGSNTINALNALDTSKKGVSQFGLNLKQNTIAAAASFATMPDAEAAPVANGTNYRGQAATDYDTADSFKFADGGVVANSYNGGPGGTDSQIYTVSYIVNVPGSQPAGTCTSTLTYICTPTF